MSWPQPEMAHPNDRECINECMAGQQSGHNVVLDALLTVGYPSQRHFFDVRPKCGGAATNSFH